MNGTGGLTSRPARVVQAIPKLSQNPLKEREEMAKLLAGSAASPRRLRSHIDGSAFVLEVEGHCQREEQSVFANM